MKVVAFVPAKGSSERIKNKNMQILDGEYLFKRKLRQLLECKEIDEVWLDSESIEMHNLTSDLPIFHHYRDSKLADNNTDGHAMFSNESTLTDADIVVQALCTAPFIDKSVIDPALKNLKNSNATSLIAVSEQKLYLWENGKPLYGDTIPNSIELPVHYIEAMSFYAVKTDKKPVKKRYTNNVILYPVNPMQFVDINNQEDLELARYICAGQRVKQVQQLKMLSKSISSCLLSDICKEHNIKHFLSSEIKSMNRGTFLGFAKTLKLKSLPKEHKDPTLKHWEGIFDALGSYQFITPGDVIVVSTDVKDKAYFGDLNAHFAYRSGAVGVVVDGPTRDVDRVTQIGLPVFAHKRTSDDIRYEGTLEEMNMPITINGITVRNNDLIFGDSDGVICIPAEYWPLVFESVKIALKKEMMVKFEATFGSDPFDVLSNIGSF
jgi:regulator of RNase E activity RraA/CMP-N-acetylneuraminic acid synthetase